MAGIALARKDKIMNKIKSLVSKSSKYNMKDRHKLEEHIMCSIRRSIFRIYLRLGIKVRGQKRNKTANY